MTGVKFKADIGLVETICLLRKVIDLTSERTQLSCPSYKNNWLGFGIRLQFKVDQVCISILVDGNTFGDDENYLYF